MEIYLDNSATTKPSEAAITAMIHALTDIYGNPSSLHRKGLDAEKLLKTSRYQMASALQIQEKEFIFTSGGTEANNLAIQGALAAQKRRSNVLITTMIEHASVLNLFQTLEKEGYQVIYLKVNQDGIIDLEELQYALDQNPALVSIMWVNNEVGSIQPICEVSRLISQRPHRPIFHVDGVQAFGKIDLPLNKCGIDLLTVSAHKFHGPKGIGGLYIRKGVKIDPRFFGGSQEHGFRPGTENIPGITGMAAAAIEASQGLKEHIHFLEGLKTKMIGGLTAEISDLKINTPPPPLSAPHILNVSFLGIRAEILLHALEDDGIYVSTRSACSSKKANYSHVLTALKLNKAEMESAIRISFSMNNSEAEIDYVIDRLKHHVSHLRRLIGGRNK